MSRIDARFAALKAAGRTGLIPFVTAGDPAPEHTVALMHALVEAGADLIELGVPFSDPMADGPVIQHASEAVAAGVDGVLLVDCPLEEASVLAPLRAAGLQLIRLAAPTTAPARMAQLCESAEGFLYYVSFAGITGAAHLSTTDIAARVAYIRARAKAPVAVGFGVRDAHSAKAIAAFADAVVIGSALVEWLAGAGQVEEIAARVRGFLAPIRAALDAP